ncbi:MAG: DUF305 domain-containing protein [Aquiluna sp.]|nr:DUF305 domain-containing protein [Aquiluna sp.]
MLLSLMLVGCTINFGTSGSEDEQGTTGNSTIDSSQAFSGWDIMFAQMMIPHHQQAVEMGALAESRAFSPDVKSLAAKIQAEQSPEITQMTRWLNDTNSPLDMGHDMNMGGMLGEAEMQALQDAKGPAFDKLFLEGMIAHHEGAIEMAQMIVDSNNSEARALGEAIIEAQNEEIRLMQTLLAQS